MEIKEKSGKENVELMEIDMSSKKSIISAVNGLKKRIDKLDVLIHNAADFDIARKLLVNTLMKRIRQLLHLHIALKKKILMLLWN